MRAYILLLPGLISQSFSWVVTSCLRKNTKTAKRSWRRKGNCERSRWQWRTESPPQLFHKLHLAPTNTFSIVVQSSIDPIFIDRSPPLDSQLFSFPFSFNPSLDDSMGGGNSKQSKCLVVGLDNSGKSTIINALKPDTKKVSQTRHPLRRTRFDPSSSRLLHSTSFMASAYISLCPYAYTVVVIVCGDRLLRWSQQLVS